MLYQQGIACDALHDVDPGVCLRIAGEKFLLLHQGLLASHGLMTEKESQCDM